MGNWKLISLSFDQFLSLFDYDFAEALFHLIHFQLNEMRPLYSSIPKKSCALVIGQDDLSSIQFFIIIIF